MNKCPVTDIEIISGFNEELYEKIEKSKDLITVKKYNEDLYLVISREPNSVPMTKIEILEYESKKIGYRIERSACQSLGIHNFASTFYENVVNSRARVEAFDVTEDG